MGPWLDIDRFWSALRDLRLGNQRGPPAILLSPRIRHHGPTTARIRRLNYPFAYAGYLVLNFFDHPRMLDPKTRRNQAFHELGTGKS